MKISISLEALTGSFVTDLDRATKEARKRAQALEADAKRYATAAAGHANRLDMQERRAPKPTAQQTPEAQNSHEPPAKRQGGAMAALLAYRKGAVQNRGSVIGG